MKRRVRYTFGAVSFVAVLFVLAWYWQARSWHPPLPGTAQGIFMEELLPEDSSFVLNFSPTDSSERARFAKLWNTVLQDKSDVVVPFFINQVLGSSLPKELLIQFSDLMEESTRFTLAQTKSSLYFLFLLTHPEGAESAVQEIVKDPRNRLSAGILGDVGYLVFGEPKDAEALVARFKSRKNIVRASSFIRQKNFRRVMKATDAPLSGYVYRAGPQSVGAVVHSFHAQDEGLIFEKSALTGKDSNYPGPLPVSLFQKTPKQDLLAYMEVPKLSMYLPKADGSFYKSFEAFTGFNYEQDFPNLLELPFALAVHDALPLLPSVTVLADFQAAPEKAQEFFTKLDTKLDNLIAISNLSLGTSSAPLLEKQSLEAPILGSRIIFYPDRVDLEAASVPLFQMLKDPVTISYGFLPENVFFISMLPNFSPVEAPDSLSSSALFQEATKLQASPDAVTLVDVEVLGDFFSRIIQTLPGEKATYDLIKKYLTPIKSFVEADTNDSGSLTGKAFLKINPS